MLCVGDDDGGCWITCRGSQPDDMPKGAADRLKVRIDSGRACATWYTRQLAAQWFAYEFAHALGGEFGLGQEVAELCQCTLPNEMLRQYFLRYCRAASVRLEKAYVPRESYHRLELHPLGGACDPSHKHWIPNLSRIG